MDTRCTRAWLLASGLTGLGPCECLRDIWRHWSGRLPAEEVSLDCLASWDHNKIQERSQSLFYEATHVSKRPWTMAGNTKSPQLLVVAGPFLHLRQQ